MTEGFDAVGPLYRSILAGKSHQRNTATTNQKSENTATTNQKS